MHTQFEGDWEDVALRFIYGNVNPKLGARRMSEYPNCTVLRDDHYGLKAQENVVMIYHFVV